MTSNRQSSPPTSGSAQETSALLVSGSPKGVSPALLQELAECCDFIVALDDGGSQLLAAGLTPHLLLGDFDSLAPDTLAHYEAQGVMVERHDSYKDAADFELGIEALYARGYRRFVATNVLGGRTDHALGALGALAGAVCNKGMEVTLRDEHETCFFVGSSSKKVLVWEEAPSSISLISWGGFSTVSLKGAEWELDHHVLSPFSTLGVSNIPHSPCLQLTVHESSTVVLLLLNLSAKSLGGNHCSNHLKK